MIKLSDYSYFNNILKNVTFDDLDSNVINYIDKFDNINEEPLYVNDGVVIYVSKKKNDIFAWVEYNTKIIIRKRQIKNMKDILKMICT